MRTSQIRYQTPEGRQPVNGTSSVRRPRYTLLDASGSSASDASAMEVVDYVHTFRGLAAYRSGHGRHGTGYMEAFLLLERGPFIELLESL